MPRPVDLRTRDRILDTAQELIARYGTTGMSLQLLADHVGLHKSTLFHHFPDKGAIIDAVTRRLMREVVDRLAPLEADDPPEIDHFVAVAEDLDEYFAARPLSALFVVREILGPNDLSHEGGQSAEIQRLFGLISGWLDRARTAGVIRRLSIRQAIVSLMGLTLFYPALIDQIGDEAPFGFPRSSGARQSRRRELRDVLRRALAP
jgi:AcrR family transcriptional regulator